jgi:hypothetical protein
MHFVFIRYTSTSLVSPMDKKKRKKKKEKKEKIMQTTNKQTTTKPLIPNKLG